MRSDERIRCGVPESLAQPGSRRPRIAGFSCGENALRAVRSVYAELPAVDRDEQRRLWRDRLEQVWRQAVRDVAERQPGAVTAAVRVAESAMRLDALHAPSEHIVYSPTTAELESWVAAVTGAGLQAVQEADVFEPAVTPDGDHI